MASRNFFRGGVKNFFLGGRGKEQIWRLLPVASLFDLPAAVGDLAADDGDDEDDCYENCNNDRQFRAVVKNDHVVIRTCFETSRSLRSKYYTSYVDMIQTCE